MNETQRLLWTRPAVEVLRIIREMATYPPASDPYPHAWPYAGPDYVPTQYLPLYERKEQ